jgi:16S rRNA (uracil1498-N3)-methyltransferase
MRAIRVIENEVSGVESKLEINDERANHLIKVVRIKPGEKILLIQGSGIAFISTVDSVSKRSIILDVTEKIKKEKAINVDLCLGIPKRDPFELTLKNAVESGYGKIYPFVADYSQWKIKNTDRISALIDSAVIQSNNLFPPEVFDMAVSLDSMQSFFGQYDHILLTTLKSNSGNIETLDKNKKYLVVVGPEGGLSEREEDLLLRHDKTVGVKLDCPILRTQNAVTAMYGFLLGKFAAL